METINKSKSDPRLKDLSQKAPKSKKIGKSPSLWEKIFVQFLSEMKLGELKLVTPDGRVHLFGDVEPDPSMRTSATVSAHIEVVDNRFFKDCILNGDIGFAEGYLYDYWRTPSIYNVIEWMILNIESNPVLSGGDRSLKTTFINLFGSFNKFRHRLKANSKSGSQKNIHFHYDIGNEFYKKMLDETMTYSSGLFKDASYNFDQMISESELITAQESKYDRLCQQLRLTETDHVLEIGCGWGGFAEYAATHYGCKITGVTISKEQLKFAQERIKKQNLAHLVELKYCDYRDVTGSFDKIVSIEMIEAVGHEHFPSFFKQIGDLLKPNGLAALQVITSPDSRYKEFVTGVDFIQKHIFPGSLLPSIGEMNRVINKVSNLHLLDLKDFGRHYSKTLRAWNQRFSALPDDQLPQGKIISEHGPDYFRRLWQFYLEYCEAAFANRNISVIQMVLTSPNNTSFD